MEKDTKQSRKKILPGYRMGMLTVAGKSEKRKNGYVVWTCRCDCGREMELDTRSLQRGAVRDCGCVSGKRAKDADLTGERFGKLTCLEPVVEDTKEANGSGELWLCLCDCGTECRVTKKQLLSGKKKSCGCLRYPPLKDFMGKEFGMLTVTAYEGKERGMHRWRCLCSCGKETVVGQTLLQSGKTRSCGCLKEKNIRSTLKLSEGTSVAMLEASKKPHSNNSSGHTGVYLNKKTGRWIAQISFKKKMYYLGSYEKKADAVRARQEGEKIHEDFLEWYYKKEQKQEE